jgi:hypothetical protein
VRHGQRDCSAKLFDTTKNKPDTLSERRRAGFDDAQKMTSEHDNLHRFGGVLKIDVAMGLGVFVRAYGAGEEVAMRLAFTRFDAFIGERARRASAPAGRRRHGRLGPAPPSRSLSCR